MVKLTSGKVGVSWEVMLKLGGVKRLWGGDLEHVRDDVL